MLRPHTSISESWSLTISLRRPNLVLWWSVHLLERRWSLLRSCGPLLGCWLPLLSWSKPLLRLSGPMFLRGSWSTLWRCRPRRRQWSGWHWTSVSDGCILHVARWRVSVDVPWFKLRRHRTRMRIAWRRSSSRLVFRFSRLQLTRWCVPLRSSILPCISNVFQSRRPITSRLRQCNSLFPVHVHQRWRLAVIDVNERGRSVIRLFTLILHLSPVFKRTSCRCVTSSIHSLSSVFNHVLTT